METANKIDKYSSTEKRGAQTARGEKKEKSKKDLLSFDGDRMKAEKYQNYKTSLQKATNPLGTILVFLCFFLMRMKVQNPSNFFFISSYLLLSYILFS